MTTKVEDSTAELLDQAAETYFNAVKTGLKLQEDVATRWTELFKDSTVAQDWPKRMQNVIADTIPLAHKNTDEAMKLIEQSTRQSMELLSKAFEVGKSPSVEAAQGKLQDLWENSLSTLQKNAQTMVQTNARVMEGWAELVKKNLDGRPSAKKAAA